MRYEPPRGKRPYPASGVAGEAMLKPTYPTPRTGGQAGRGAQSRMNPTDPAAQLKSVMRANAVKRAAPAKSQKDLTGDVGDYLGGPQPVPAPQARRRRGGNGRSRSPRPQAYPP